MKLLILVSLYMIPFIINWYYLHLTYFNKKGDCFNTSKPELFDLWCVVIPLFNFACMFFALRHWEEWKSSKYRGEESSLLTMFFGGKPDKDQLSK